VYILPRIACALCGTPYDVLMHKTLNILIIIGLAILLLVWAERVELFSITGDEVVDATTEARCAEFRRDVEGELVMGYGDRIKQFLKGCW